MSEKPPAEQPAPSFEKGLEELEAVVKALESGDLPLEKALELFEKGMTLSSQCSRQLEEAETRVETLIKKNNKVTPEPFRTDK